MILQTTCSGATMFFEHGVLHNINDQPAVISKFKKEWWYEGVMHRDNGAAAVISHREHPLSITEKWFVYGILHRENGPAVINTINGKIQMYRFYLDGKYLSTSEYLAEVKSRISQSSHTVLLLTYSNGNN